MDLFGLELENGIDRADTQFDMMVWWSFPLCQAILRFFLFSAILLTKRENCFTYTSGYFRNITERVREKSGKRAIN
ncbi:MAG: hypothetical protein D8M57_01610 [Candidatus Scalindua sp. AMX11]|nr:MAG: hypothetical protein DWQ00_15595 [Candidatus Scalindua sp.]TDE66759.1 MAG: hypothetical protein D8M57_01610 [Candidatus Scalindua sp. AMX11]